MKPGKAGQRRGEAGQVLRWRPRFCRFLPELWKWKAAQTCPTLCNPVDYTVHEILQARILERVAYPFSSRSSRPKTWTRVSCIAGGFFTNWATREAHGELCKVCPGQVLDVGPSTPVTDHKLVVAVKGILGSLLVGPWTHWPRPVSDGGQCELLGGSSQKLGDGCAGLVRGTGSVYLGKGWVVQTACIGTDLGRITLSGDQFFSFRRKDRKKGYVKSPCYWED